MKWQRAYVFFAMALASTATLLLVTQQGHGERGRGFFCDSEHALHPEIQWKRAEKGNRLGNYDAILVCHSSAVRINSNLSFDSTIKWKREKGTYLATIPEESLYVIGGQLETDVEIKVEIMETRGDVFISADHKRIRNLGVSRAYSPSREALEELEKQELQQNRDLEAIEWRPLAQDQQLKPWDMVWTRPNSRIEIEIIKEGSRRYVDEATTVRGPSGNFTNKRRFPGDSYFIMHPESYLEARVRKIIGEARIAVSHERVKAFYNKYRIPLSMREGFDQATRRKWKEGLMKEELE